MIFGVQSLAFVFALPAIPKENITAATQSAWRIVLLDDVDTSPFSVEEFKHLQDVHKIIAGFYVVSAAIIIISRQRKKRMNRRGYIVAATVVGTVTVIAALLFPFFFNTFHQVFFPQGNYTFPVNSLLIQAFPLPFWFLNFLILQIGVIALLLWEAHRADRGKL